jgi:hypothetical protein
MPDPRIRPQRGFAVGDDGVWAGRLFCTGFQDDLGSFYILSVLFLKTDVVERTNHRKQSSKEDCLYFYTDIK